MRISRNPPPTRRPASDLIDAVVDNMRSNLEELRYSIVAPSRYTVYLSPPEFERLQGLIPRLQAEAVRALDEEMARLNRRSRPRRAFERLLGRPRVLDHAEPEWHVEFLPDPDDELEHEQDILVASELVLSGGPEVGAGERTRRVTTVTGATDRASRAVSRSESASAAPAVVSAPAPVAVASAAPSAVSASAIARLTCEDTRGRHRHDITRDSTTIGRGGLRFPVDVRIAASDEVSREHARIRRDPTAGTFHLIDLSTHGTTIDGVRIPRGYDDDGGAKRENGASVELPRRARIGLAGVVMIEFEQLG